MLMVYVCVSRKYRDDQVLNQISLRGMEYDSPMWELEEMQGERGEGGREGGERVLLLRLVTQCIVTECVVVLNRSTCQSIKVKSGNQLLSRGRTSLTSLPPPLSASPPQPSTLSPSHPHTLPRPPTHSSLPLPTQRGTY